MFYCESCGAATETATEKCVVCQQPFVGTDQQEVTLSTGDTGDLGSKNKDNEAPTLLKDRYQILQQVGTGGFGAVYKAIDTQSDNRTVAIKEIKLQGLKPNEIIDATDTFNREVNILSDLRHPNLPRVYDHFTGPEHWYLVMDFIGGQTLESYLDTQGGRLPLSDIFTIGIQICTVLDYLHTRQPAIIFRDLKPTNVMITEYKQVYLIDFGAARYFKAGRSKDTIAFGSPGYAAPEQYGKAQTTARSDIYSLGATLHEALTGEDPAEEAFHFSLPHVPGVEIPLALKTLLFRMVDMDASKRPASAAAVKTELWRISTQHTQQLYPLPNSSSSIPPYRQIFGVGQPPPASWATSAPSVQQAQMQLGMAQTPLPRKHGISRRAVTSMVILGIASVAFLENTHLFSHGYYPNNAQSVPPSMATSYSLDLQGSFTFHTNDITSLAWSPQGQFIASGSMDDTLRIWNSTIDGQETIHTLPDGVRAVGWSSDGAYVAAASGGKTGTVQIWNSTAAGGDQPVTSFSAPSSGAMNALAWTPNGYTVALGSDDGNVRIINGSQPSSYNPITVYTGHTGAISSLAWSPAGDYLASGGVDNTVHVWHAYASCERNSANNAFVFSQHTDRVTAIAWTPNQSYLISGSADQTAQVWDMNNNNLQTYNMAAAVSAIAVSSSQNYLAISTEDGSVSLFRLFDSEPFAIIRGLGVPARSIAWSPDGSSLVVGGDDRKATIWAIEINTSRNYQRRWQSW